MNATPVATARISVSDYRRISGAADTVLRGRRFSPRSSVAPQQDAPHCWAVVADAVDPRDYIRVYGGFIFRGKEAAYLPQPVTAKTPPFPEWYPDPDPLLGEPPSSTQGADFLRVSIGVTLAERAALDGKMGFVYWRMKEEVDEEDAEDVKNKWPGQFAVAADADAMETAFEDYDQIMIVATLLWDALEEHRYRIRQFNAAPISVPEAPLRFEVVTDHGDYLMCARVASLDAAQQPVPVDPGEEEEALYKVWKPWLLRSTPFDTLTRDGIAYDYHATTVGLRKATNAEDVEEWQTITPSYSLRTTGETAQAGELLHAVPAGNGEFQDINTAGRCWAETDAPA